MLYPMAVGIKDLRWHDLCHTFASWHAQADTPINILQKLSGWAEYSMVQRYAHFSSEHLEAYANTPGTKLEVKMSLDAAATP